MNRKYLVYTILIVGFVLVGWLAYDFFINKPGDYQLEGFTCPEGTYPVTVFDERGSRAVKADCIEEESIDSFASNGYVGNPGDCDCESADEPVCGQDLKTYESSCVAECLEVEVLYTGSCQVFDPVQRLPERCAQCDLTCAEDQVMYQDAQGCPICECKSSEIIIESSD